MVWLEALTKAEGKGGSGLVPMSGHKGSLFGASIKGNSACA